VSAFDLATGARTDLVASGLGVANGSKRRLPGVSVDGHWVAVARADSTIAVWHDGVGPTVMSGHTGWITDGAFSPRGDTAYTAATDGTVREWSLTTGDSRILFHGDRGEPAWGFAVSKDGGRLAVGIGERLVILDPEGKQLAAASIGATPSKGCTRTIRFDPTGNRLASGRCDGMVLVWTPAAGPPIALQTSRRAVASFAFSADGSRLAGAMADRTVRVWDAVSGRLGATFGGHTDLVEAVAFSPDGRSLASSSYDRTVRVWDLATGASRVLRGHDGSVDSLMWTPDGARLISGSRDGTLRVWRAPSLAPPRAGEVRASLEHVTSAVIAVDDRPATPADTTPGG
jgi:WD40 repeat protein